MKDLTELINYYKINREDVILYSELRKQQKQYRWAVYSRELARIGKERKRIHKKYKLSFMDSGQLGVLLNELPLITDSNYDSIVSSPKKVTAVSDLSSVEKDRQRIDQQGKEVERYSPGDAEFILKTAGGSKLAVVKLIQDLTGLDLKEANDTMLSAPISLAVDININDAKLWAASFEAVDAEVEILTKAQREELDLFKNINKRIDAVDTALKKISDLEIPSVAEYKSNVVEHEDVISKKSGDNQLYSFLKVDSFLNDFRNRIKLDQTELSNGIDVERIKSDVQKNSSGSIQNQWDVIATLEGREEITFGFKLEKVLTLGENMTASMEAQITTLEFYHSMANAMLIYYLKDRKIRYFELYEAFEKMGVFDSTWEKNVLSKLESIDIRLANIGGHLIELNRNFESLADASENIVSELQNINTSLITNNMLTAISTYQTWRINRNTKSLER